jgi:hypothetical protein
VALVLAPGVAYIGSLALVAGEWGLGVGALLCAAVSLVLSVAWFWCINNGFLTQFSLRTLLIATTLIAVVLGLVVWSMG